MYYITALLRPQNTVRGEGAALDFMHALLQDKVVTPLRNDILFDSSSRGAEVEKSGSAYW